MVKVAKMRPTKGFVIAEPIGNEQPSGYVSVTKETPQRAVILAVGDSTWYEGGKQVFEAPCQVGDIVIHSGYGFEDFHSEGKHYRIIPFSKVLAVV